MEEMPTDHLWLEYTGQSAREIFAAKKTHRLDSLLCALEEGIQLRQSRHGKKGTTDVERTLLAVMTLDREVNNGGYDQFFLNSSRQYARGIVQALDRIGCRETAALTAKAIDALGLEQITVKGVSEAIAKRDPKRNRVLNACDKKFYKLVEIGSKLFAFLEANQDKIALERTTVPPRPKKRGARPDIIKLKVNLQSTPMTDLSFDCVRLVTLELASQHAIEATSDEIDATVNMYLFDLALRSNNLAACEPVALKTFDLNKEDTMQCVYHRDYVNQLIAAGNHLLADSFTLMYLDYLKDEDRSIDFILNRIKFFAEPIRNNPRALPESVLFFAQHFPEIST